MSEGSTFGLRVARQLVSRLCHDLVGPMGAVNNGLELVAESPDDSEEALGLVDQSARQMMARFMFLRAALGMGGVRNPTLPAELRTTVEQIIAGNVTLEWLDDGAEGAAIEAEAAKLILNMILMGIESLPRGGVVSVRFAEDGGVMTVDVRGRGTGARPRDDMFAALAPEVDEETITARNVAVYLARKIAELIGAGLRVTESGADEVLISATIP